MKKLFLLILMTGALTGYLKSQSNINADCINAIPLCSTPNFTFNATSGVGTVTDIPSPSNISNPSTNPASSNSGCLLSGELKPQWLLITVGNAGFLEFIFGAANSSNPQVGYYDWAMWPYTPATCGNIQNNTLPPIRCNWNASSTGGTGIASSTNQPSGSSPGNFEPPLAVLPCQQYIICISNYSGVNTLVSFQSLGTASLTCNPSCINVNHPVLCSGSTSSIVASSSGNLTNITYSINPGGIISTTPTFVINPAVSTSYTVYATGINSSSATVTQSVVSNATVNPQPSAIPTVTQASCMNQGNAFNLGLGFSPSGPVPNYTVTWSTLPSGVNSPTQTSNIGVMAPGVYNATITATGGCFTVTSFSLDPTPAPANVSLTPFGPTYTVTCFDPTVTITGANSSFNYTWTNGIIAPINGPVAALNNTCTGNWTITVQNPVSGCVTTKTITVGINTLVPTSILSPTFQNITCNLSSITTITASSSQTVNITHLFSSPQTATFSANSSTVAYTPGGTGTFTHCLINDINGCSSCKQFTVFSSQGFPTFNVVSPQNFTLGCTTKSVATINIINGSTSLPPGGPVSYTILAPGSPTVTPSGTLSNVSTYTVNVPGTYTVITKDNGSFCETRVPVSVISNKFGPSLDTVAVPRQVLTCDEPKVTLEALSQTPNISYNWSYPGVAGNLPGSTITINTNTLAPTTTLVANYTITITDNNNTCITTSVIPISQNIFPPKAAVSNGGVSAISCKTSSLVLTNISTTGIPPGSQFPTSLPVVGYIWDGPSPQTKLQMNSTYVGLTVGNYTLTARDLNNGCISTTIITIADDRQFPLVNSPVAPVTPSLDCGAANATLTPIINTATTGLSFSWTPPSGAATTARDQFILRTNKTGIYRLLTTNTLNGCASVSEMTVANGVLTGGFIADKEKGFAPLKVNFSNTSASSTGNSSIIAAWHFGNGTFSITNSASVSPETVFNSAGIYTVTAYITKGNCVDTVSKIIEVDIASKLEIPNVFTPNGDNVNDIYFLKTAGLRKITIKIYDRWGHKVYDLVSEQGNIAWDGKNQFGVDVAEGTYFYVLDAEGNDGQIFNQKGNISLMR